MQQARIQGAAAEYRKEGGSWWCTRHRAVGREKKQMAPSCCRASSSPRLSALIAACAPGYTPATTRYAQKESSCFCSRNASSPEISPSRWRFPAPAPARDERRGASPIQPATSSKTGSAQRDRAGGEALLLTELGRLAAIALAPVVAVVQELLRQLLGPDSLALALWALDRARTSVAHSRRATTSAAATIRKTALAGRIWG